MLLSCMCLYILEINPLSVASFANVSSQPIGCLFILFMVSIAVQNLVSLIRSHEFIFAFISIALADLRKCWYDYVREIVFINFFAVLGLHCCMQAFSRCSE